MPRRFEQMRQGLGMTTESPQCVKVWRQFRIEAAAVASQLAFAQQGVGAGGEGVGGDRRLASEAVGVGAAHGGEGGSGEEGVLAVREEEAGEVAFGEALALAEHGEALVRWLARRLHFPGSAVGRLAAGGRQLELIEPGEEAGVESVGEALFRGFRFRLWGLRVVRGLFGGCARHGFSPFSF